MIVVVDDDPLVQRTCQLCLEPLGYKVALASNGTEALETIEKNSVSAVLVDIFMPEMDGIETLLSIKRNFPTIPVIVMSGGGARARLDFLAAATRFGADQVIKKPFSTEDLVSAISRHH